MTEHLLAALLARADRHAPFLSVPTGPQLSYGEIADRSAFLAGGLQAAGAVAGDRVVVQVDKSPDAVALYLGCLQAGFVYVPINTAYTPAEVSYFVEDAGASILVCRPEDAADRSAAAGAATLLTLGANGEGTLPDLATGAEPFTEIIDRGGDDLACMLYTSGTTGRSKGAMLTHSTLLTNGRSLHEAWAWEEGDVLLHTLPIFHVHGLFVALHCAMLNGSEVIFLPGFDVTEIRDQLPDATVMMGVPTHYVRLLSDPEFGAADCSSVRLFTSGSAPMTAAVHEAFTARTGHEIVERYGMTECGIITSNPVDGERSAGTVGFPVPGVEVRVVDGNVQTRGTSKFAGYWQMPSKTSESITDDGWFITGDVGELDSDGRLTLAGRSSDMIISGGYNIYPKEIETVLDAGTGVVESAVIGVPHADFGEGVIAVIATKSGTEQGSTVDDLKIRCAAELARFKHPKHYIFIEELPRNAMGKVQKAELRKQHANVFNDGP